MRTGEFSPGVLLVREIAGRVMGEERRKWQELLGGAVSGVSPIQGNSLADVITNTVPPLGTAVQIGQNKNYFTDRPIATAGADERASALARAAAAGLSPAARAVGRPEVRPSQVEFALRDYLGGVGQML